MRAMLILPPLLLAASATAAVASPGPGTYELIPEEGPPSFPFDLHGGDIRFDGMVNGHPVKLLLDDGYMWDPILFWGGPDTDALSLEPDGEVSVGDEGDENALASTTASGIALRFPGVEFRDQTAVICPPESGVAAMWEGSVGQVSCTFLKHFVVDIDFDAMRITLIEPDAFEPASDAVSVPWEPLEVGAMAIPGRIVLDDGRAIDMLLEMDLGYNHQLRLALGADHGLTAPEGAEPASLGFNIQAEELRGFRGRIPRVEIGGFVVRDVAGSFVQESQKDEVEHEAMIGLELLSRFNLTFDYTRGRLFLEPNESFREPFDGSPDGR